MASFIKELVVRLPEGEEIDFQAGGYIQIECPPHDLSYKDFDIDEEFHDEWDHYNLWRYESHVKEARCAPTRWRAFRLEERDVIKLNVRIATPPPGAGDKIPPGIVSSYIFNLKPGDKTKISGRSASSSPRTPTTRWCSSAAVPAWRRCARTSSTSSSACIRIAR